MNKLYGKIIEPKHKLINILHGTTVPPMLQKPNKRFLKLKKKKNMAVKKLEKNSEIQ